MSFLPHQDGIKPPDLQIWRNNAIFDKGDSVDSWFPSKSITLNPSESLDLDSSKENQNPLVDKSLVSFKSPNPIHPLHPNGAVLESQGKPLKLLFKQGIRCPLINDFNEEGQGGCDESKIDDEIEEIEMEISRLTSKVEALRVKKAEKEHERVARMGLKNSTCSKRNEESMGERTKREFRRRGLSLGPGFIESSRSRALEKKGSSISVKARQTRRNSCFSKIQEGDEGKTVRRNPPVKQENNPVQSIQSIKKPSFLNVRDFNEDKVTKQRGGRSLSLSPESRLPVSMFQGSKRGLTTVGSKKGVKKESGFLSSIQPKKLYNEACKKPVKIGRAVASRYNRFSLQSTGSQKLVQQRKRSLPEVDKEDDDKCSFSVENAQDLGLNQGTGTRRVKKRWEIPNELVIHESLESPPPSLSKRADLLPKIRTKGCIMKESPRDSGPAKRVVELAGRKSYFSNESKAAKTSLGQALRFDDGEE